MYSSKLRTPVARFAAFGTPSKLFSRFVSHHHADPSKLRNLAICAHIGVLFPVFHAV